MSETETPCWIWPGAIATGTTSTGGGYGKVWVGERRVGAHRAVYEAARGPIPEGLELHHLCGIRACVNPDHLEPVTRATHSRYAQRTKLTPEDVQAIRASDEDEHHLAERFGVSRPLIYNIRARRCWKDLP